MVRMGNTWVSSMPPSSSSFNSSSYFQNYPLISALMAFALAQSIKFFTTWYKEKRWDPKQLIGSGGMPSSHSSTVTSLAIAIGFQDGFRSSLFAASMIFATVVMYDASGVQWHTGKQAEVMNQIVFELPAEHPLAETKPLRELLGHTPAQIGKLTELGRELAGEIVAEKAIRFQDRAGEESTAEIEGFEQGGIADISGENANEIVPRCVESSQPCEGTDSCREEPSKVIVADIEIAELGEGGQSCR